MIATAAADELPMPRLSDSMEEGTIVRWLKSPGDAVAVGEGLVEIDTDKAQVVHESDVAGMVLELLAAEGDVVAVGAGIARVGDPRRDKVSPVARRLATDLGIDLATITGSGPGGRIVKADVEAAVPVETAGPAEPPTAVASGKGTVELVPPTALQRTVARRMTESTTTIPHFHVSAEIDMTRCRDARSRVRANGEPAPSYSAMVVKACALALRAWPKANAAWTEAGFELYSRVNVGIAVAAEGVLMVPTIFDADRKGIGEIAAESAALAEQVRAGTIAPADLADGTFTVSNLGMYGVDDFAAVINPPQVAILAVGAIAESPVGRDGEVTLAPLMRATLACDHRVLYGADAAALLAHVRRLLEEPLGLAG